MCLFGVMLYNILALSTQNQRPFTRTSSFKLHFWSSHRHFEIHKSYWQNIQQIFGGKTVRTWTNIFVLFLLHKPMVFLGDSGYLKQVFIDNHTNLHKDPFIYHKIGFIYGKRGGGYGLISNTDEQSWRKRRLLMNPAFHRRCLRDFMSKFNVSDRFLARMDMHGCQC